MIIMSFGSRIKKLRTEKHISQSKLASELGISTNAVSQYETDKRFPDQKCIIKICLFFGVSSDYLFGLSDIPQPSISLSKLSSKCEEYSEAQIAAINNLIAAFNK